MDMTLGIPCRADEPGLRPTLDSLWDACLHPELPAGFVTDVIICINGVKSGEVCPPLAAVQSFCAEHSIPLREVRLDGEGVTPVSATDGSGPVPLSCTVLLTPWLGKPRAWNMIWQRAGGDLVLFCDADVRVEREAVYHLYTRLQREAALSLVAAREVPVLEGGGTLWGRMGEIPYRFDFGNAGGRLYVMRKGALPEAMPEDLLLEDAWLTVAVDRRRVAKELDARVYFLPPATFTDYLAERVRTEGGKLQIRLRYAPLLAHGPVARYRWTQFVREIPVREYPLVLLALGVRGLARVWAWVALRRTDFYSLYRPFPSTKGWMSTQR